MRRTARAIEALGQAFSASISATIGRPLLDDQHRIKITPEPEPEPTAGPHEPGRSRRSIRSRYRAAFGMDTPSGRLYEQLHRR